MDDDEPDVAVPNEACTMCGGTGRVSDGSECPTCRGTGRVDAQMPGGSY